MSAYAIIVDFRLFPGQREAFRKLIDVNARESAQIEEGCRRVDVALQQLLFGQEKQPDYAYTCGSRTLEGPGSSRSCTESAGGVAAGRHSLPRVSRRSRRRPTQRAARQRAFSFFAISSKRAERSLANLSNSSRASGSSSLARSRSA